MFSVQPQQICEPINRTAMEGNPANQSSEFSTDQETRGRSPNRDVDTEPNGFQSGQTSTASVVQYPGHYQPEWLPDHEANSCMCCDNLFTLIKRRHHCRACGKIFCSDCCSKKAQLAYLDNKEARVCDKCSHYIEHSLGYVIRPSASSRQLEQNPESSESQTRPSSSPRVHGVLKTGNNTRTNLSDCNTSTSSATDQQSGKQVIFADGIRPGTDLSESFPYPVPSSSVSSEGTSSASFSLLTRQNRGVDIHMSNKRSKSGKSVNDHSTKNITVCDELGYLPPIVITNDSSVNVGGDQELSSSSSLARLITSQFKSTATKKTIQASMESRNSPLNGIIKFTDICGLVGLDNVVTFLLLKDFLLKVKLIKKHCCIDRGFEAEDKIDLEQVDMKTRENRSPDYWCFASEGLSRFGQNEVVLVIDKDEDDPCIPRDVFKIYLTLHELALRRQSLENLGNLLFQDGLFGSRDTVGLLFIRTLNDHCLKNLILPNKSFLVALILQRWEVPWSKVFPMRLLLRLGHKLGVYPYPIISFRTRDPVYYEVGHTIISILGDFRNFRYAITHVDGMKVMVNKVTQRVLVQLQQSSYQQFNKVLDSSNNEHVLAWSSCPFPEANGHLVSVQNEDGHYETVEFYKKSSEKISFEELESNKILGASFIIFSGALKVDQSGQSAKISIVEDGLLIQIQSCTMSALRNAIHFMHHFDIDCESKQDPLNRVEIDWILEDA